MADEKSDDKQSQGSAPSSHTSTSLSPSLQEEIDQEKKTPVVQQKPKHHQHPHHEHHHHKNKHHKHHHHTGHHHRHHHHRHHHHHHRRISPAPPPHHNRPLVVGEDPKIDKPMHIDEWVEKTVEVASKEVKKEKDKSKSHGGGLKGGSLLHSLYSGNKFSTSSSSSGSAAGLLGGRGPNKKLLYDMDSLPDMDTERRFPRSKSNTDVRPLVQPKKDRERHSFSDDEAGSVYSWASSSSQSLASSAENPAEPLVEEPPPTETLLFHQNQKYKVGVEFRDLRFYGPWSGKVFFLMGTNHIMTALFTLFMLRYNRESFYQVDRAPLELWIITAISILVYFGVWVLTWVYGTGWPPMIQVLPLLATWVCIAFGSGSLVVILGGSNSFLPAFFGLSGEAFLILGLCSVTASMETLGWNLAIVTTVSMFFLTLALLLTSALIGHFSIYILVASLPALVHTLLVVWELGEFVSGERLELRAQHLILTATLLPLSAILNPPAALIRHLQARRRRRTVPHHNPKKK